MVEINLLDDRRRQVVARQSVARKTTLVSVVVVAATAFLAFMAVAYHQFENSREATLTNTIKSKEAEVKQFRYALESQWLLTQKLASLEEIWSSRQYRAAKLDIFEQLTTNPLLSIRQTNFGNLAESNTMEIQANVENRTNAELVFGQLEQMQQSGQLSSVTLDSLSRTGDGTFRLSAQLLIPKTGRDEEN